ncbi:replication initiator protein A [Leuconostoc gelidum subsp. gelidum]|uniref:replication initiator protein A n=1 Tax=Leuconostoc gelidum TaxID=1244 RepID=UPI001CC45F5D|nr:replication initiator protein A [Leuconostoc gelidum]MBZ6013850.1 replication initiator protein A [Leuconostoc gelidum subsp. gelidum]
MERVSKNQVETNERFYKIPKALFENETYIEMKLETKMAYAILRDRFLLSIKNNWIDKNGDVYLIYKNSDLQSMLSVGEKKSISLKKELADFGLLEEERQGLNKPNRLYVGNINADFEVIHRANPLGEKELSKRQSSETENSETNLSETEINPLDDEKNTNINAGNSKQKNSSSDSLITIGELLAANQDVRSLVHALIPDLLLNDPEQASVVVNALVHAKTYLLDELQNGNTILAVKELTYGEDSIITIIKQAAEEQLAYMSDHLASYQKFGSYFSKGLDDRVHIAITTRQSVSRLSI